MDLLAHLEAYVATADERSFTGAADLLGIAQPVLSRRIKTLERHFGGELFDRSRRQITSTALGHALLPHARDVLGRVSHLRQVARAASASATRALGVPPDCDPAALAGVIRAGTEHGMTIAVHELPAAERLSGLGDGSLAFAPLRVPPESASCRVVLGLATAEPLAVRSVHLENLRPRRGERAGSSLALLVTAEDGAGPAAERLRRAVARAGLPEGRVREVGATATAVAEALAGSAMLLCAEPFARRHGMHWAPLADVSLHRGYELAAAQGGPALPGWLRPPLVEVIGAATGARDAVQGGAAADQRDRLAARG